MKTDALRQTYLDFFKSKGHKMFPSDSLVPADDPSLLFTGAGMNQFKPYFLGLKKDVKRATSCQKCLRTADLDRVGKTAYHHSFFEMLGNFSFGDYFKEGAIEWGWEFVTRALGLKPDRLWVSVYAEDDEAFAIWKNKIGLPESRIVRMGAEDNFWPANAPEDGPNGPCGPCSEIYVGQTPGKGVEIWNLVFTQFDRQPDGSLPPLPQKNIDTGMGLERTAAVLQGVESNFDTDNFRILRKQLHEFIQNPGNQVARENAVLDHARAVTFAIADGAYPSNEGRGYVVRKIIRLANQHLMSLCHSGRNASLHRLVPAIAHVYGAMYPELTAREKTISTIIEKEEQAFMEIYKTQVPNLRHKLENVKKTFVPMTTWVKTVVFPYYDTYGLPLETIIEICNEVGMEFDIDLFNQSLDEQRKRSRESSKITGEIFSKSAVYTLVDGLAPTQFLGYDSIEENNANLLRIIKGESIVSELREGERGVLLFDRSPFYAEAGGQVGDTGHVTMSGFEAEVLDTQYLDRCIGHQVLVKKGFAMTATRFRLVVDAERRADIMKNHTATHLLHSALRKVLGEHVKQSGSLVAKDYLRFDFTHFSAVEPAALARVEEMVNAEIRKNTTLQKKVIGKEQALKEGAIAFFGEKYGDEVRVVSIGDFSTELCGGTHLESTGQIGLFKIVSEGSIQAGVRRIEAVTGHWAENFVQEAVNELQLITKELSLSNNLIGNIQQKQKHIKSLKSKLFNIIDKKMKEETKKRLKDAAEVNGVKQFYMPITADKNLISNDIQFLKTQNTSFFGLFVSSYADKFDYTIAASGDLVLSGWDSNIFLKQINNYVGGNGGGKADVASGGSKNIQKKDELYNYFITGTSNFVYSIKSK